MKTFKTPAGTTLPLLDFRGKDYLQVAHRLVWFREERPDWSIQTEMIHSGADHAIFKATIYNEKAYGLATAHKREDAKHFPDFMEKAETGAIGRALALIGYGTQFAPDLDEGDRIVDSPLARPGSVAAASVRPEQPAPGDGHVKDVGYRIPFGKYAKRSLEEVGVDDLRSYVNYLESSAQKKNQPIVGQVKDFIERAEQLIAAHENNGTVPF